VELINIYELRWHEPRILGQEFLAPSVAGVSDQELINYL